MVAFFVLLFSMSEIDTHRWGGAAQALDRQFDLRAQDDAARSGVTVGDTRFAVGEGDALGYLERVLAGHMREQPTLAAARLVRDDDLLRSEEHTSELQSLMRISYA